MRFRVAESQPKPPPSSSSSATTSAPPSSSSPQPPPPAASHQTNQSQPERPHPNPPSLTTPAKSRVEDVSMDGRAGAVSREKLKSGFNLGFSTIPGENVHASVHSEAPPLVPPPVIGEVDQKSDSGSSISTEAYNSEDEHGARAAEVAAAAAAEVAGGLGATPHLNTEQREVLFRSELASRAWRISEVRADGNCLFRALAYAAWGDEDHHGLLRGRVMDYVVEERDYFSQFVAEDFPRYVRRKRRDGTHGNHLELQAAADLFGSRIEVYAYSLVPCAVITPAVGGTPGPLLRLSFHRGSHYNAVVGATPKKLCPKKLAVAAAESARRRNLNRTHLENSANNNRNEDARIAALADSLATEEELEQVALELSIAESHKARLCAGGASSGAGSAGQAGSSSSGRYNSGAQMPAPYQEGPLSASANTPDPPNASKAGPSGGSSSAAGPSHAWRTSDEDDETR